MTYLRAHLIAIGIIKPGTPKRRLGLALRMDAKGKSEAKKHVAEYLAEPWIFNTRPFWWPSPEEWFDESIGTPMVAKS